MPMEIKIARLIIFEENKPIRQIAIKQELSSPITIGRLGEGALIDLNSSFISRVHAQIELREENNLYLIDNNSTNGTFVNGVKINEIKLQNADTISFGTKSNYKIVVEYIPTQSVDLTNFVNQQNKHNNIYDLLQNKEAITIGRSLDCDIVLPELSITRLHASIYKNTNNEYLIKDLGSKNGTFLNGKRITEPTIITDNDSINIGAYKFKLKRPVEDIRRYNAIVAEGVTKVVNNGKHTILHDVSFRVPSQEFVAIMGPSGCGKSTLLRALNGDFPASAGKVYIYGMELYENYDYLKRMIGYVPQDDIVHKELTIEKSLYYAAKLRLSGDVTRQDIEQKIDEVLENLNINDPELRQRKVGDLSGGQRKRVSIAVELLTDPSILFLDEPTSPLDPETIEDFLTCLSHLTQKGTTIMMVTHKPDDLYYVKNILFLSKGGFLAYFGSKDKFLSFFEAKNVIEVYSKNSTSQLGMLWTQKLRGMYPQSGVVHTPNNDLDKKGNESLFKQFFWLTVRNFNIKTNDRSNTLILLLQAPIIAFLVVLIFNELEISVLFLITISAIWFGTNNSAKEIVGEQSIYRRERMFNLQILPYILSKIFTLCFFGFLQVLAFIAIVYCFVGKQPVTFNHYWQSCGMMFFLSLSATLLGLLISAIVSNTEKVMTVIPIVLIPQIMLAGVMATIPEKSIVEFVSYGMLSRWGTQGFAYIQEQVRSYMADPLCPQELVYRTVNAVDFMNLPNTINLPNTLAANLYALSVIDVIVFVLLLIIMKRKDSV